MLCCHKLFSFLSYSVFNLLFPSLSQLGSAPSWRQLVYFTTYLSPLSTVFLIFFQNFFYFFKIFYSFRFASRTACLYYHFIFPLSTVFSTFFDFFEKILKFYALTRVRVTFSPLISTSLVKPSLLPSIISSAKTSSLKLARANASPAFPSAI